MSKTILFEKSFASHEKSKYWSDKNLLKPNDVMKGTHKKYIFNCDCGHEFESAIQNIIKNSWCSYCSNPPRKLCDNIDCKKCLEKSFANHEKAHYWSDKNNILPRQVFINSNTKYIFNCSCGHEFETTIDSINRRDNWCPYCCVPIKKLCGDINCKNCFDKSFASHEKSQHWSDKNKLKPINITYCSGLAFIFKCNLCNHEFDMNISTITSKKSWCPYCCIPTKKLCDDNECKSCFEKSFKSHDKSNYLLDKTLNIRKIFKYSNDKYEFKCNICDHIFETQICKITNMNRWCPYCCNPPQKLCDDKACKKCFDKSFASNEKSKFWSIDNNLLSRQIFNSSHNKYNFECEQKHKFSKMISNIIKKSWCPYCVNKTEQILFDKLNPIYTNLQQQYRIDWCKSDTTYKYYPFDFVLEEQKIIIELDGRQHFEQVRNWDNPDKTQERDKYKMKQANNNGYSVIRLLQEDVYYDTYQWLEELKINIEKIITESKVQNIFMCQDDEYKIFEVLE
jgi:very-short-patch-repair endonuclease